MFTWTNNTWSQRAQQAMVGRSTTFAHAAIAASAMTSNPMVAAAGPNRGIRVALQCFDKTRRQNPCVEVQPYAARIYVRNSSRTSRCRGAWCAVGGWRRRFQWPRSPRRTQRSTSRRYWLRQHRSERAGCTRTHGTHTWCSRACIPRDWPTLI